MQGKAREKIERDRERLLLSRELVTIHTDVPLDPGFEGLRPPEPDLRAMHALFQKLGFVEPAQKGSGRRRATRRATTARCETAAELEAMLGELRAAGAFALDTETTSLFPLEAELVGMSFSRRDRPRVVRAVQPRAAGAGRRDEGAARRAAAAARGSGAERVGQNYKYDALVLSAHGVELSAAGLRHDGGVASACPARCAATGSTTSRWPTSTCRRSRPPS